MAVRDYEAGDGSSRTAIISLIVLFVAGLILLLFVDEEKAREAKLAGAF
jgi:MFS-type transporter involved in bile tolerance (Atg22 family)